MACLAKSPSAISTWQRPQMPRPPQTESRSTPSPRAAASRLVPSANSPRLPDGVKTTRWALNGNFSDAGSCPGAPAPLAPAAAGARLSLRRWFAIFAYPCPAIGVVAHDNVGAKDGLDVLGVERIHDRRGEAGADHHREECRRQSAAIGQAEGEVRRAAAGVDLELSVQA